jgi:hypothetical protein
MATPRVVATSRMRARCRGAAAGRLVSLYLLLGDAEALGESALAPAAGEARLDQQRSETCQRRRLKRGDLAGSETLVLMQLGSEVIGLSSYGVDLKLRQLGPRPSGGGCFEILQRLLELAQVRRAMLETCG